MHEQGPSDPSAVAGMHKGLPKYVNVNLGALSEFPESQEVSLDSLKQAGHIKVSGRDKQLPLKVLLTPMVWHCHLVEACNLHQPSCAP